MGKYSNSGCVCPTQNNAKSKKNGKCYREGKVTRNPFLNFLRQYRKEHCGLSIIQIAVDGGKQWGSMGQDQRRPFMEMAQKAPKVKRHNKRRGNRPRRGVRIC